MSTDERSARRGLQPRVSSRDRGVLGPVRRIVTEVDAAGQARIQSDGVPTQVYTIPGNGPTVYEIWHTAQNPSRDGSRMRILDFLPEGRDRASSDRASLRKDPSSWMGAAGETAAVPLPAHCVDYCIVLLGEMTLIREETETVVRAGDVVVQRDTQHAWVNRSGRLSRVAFILVETPLDDNSPARPD